MSIRQCDRCGKVAYASNRAAALVAARAVKAADRPRVLSVYACPKGNGWHLTSMTQGRKR